MLISDGETCDNTHQSINQQKGNDMKSLCQFRLITASSATRGWTLLRRTKYMAVAAFAVVMSSYAETWYVDAENGNDAWDGKVPAVNAVPGSGMGPKQTLAVFTNLLTKGDTIYVAPGR